MFDRSRILIYGFSVTADKNGYATLTKSWLETTYQGCQVDICGTGGVDLDFPAIATSIFSPDYDYVILEVMTGLERATTMSEARFLDLYKTILINLQKMTIKPIALELYRKDVNYPKDKIRHLADEIHRALGIPSISLFEVAQIAHTEGGELFRDRVHTTAIGAAFYAEHLCAELAKLSHNRPNYSMLEYSAPYEAVHMTQLRGDLPTSIMKRTGYREICVEFSDSVDVIFPQTRQLFCATYMLTPMTGYTIITSDLSDESRILPGYDSHSYYSRIGIKSFPPLAGRRFTFTHQAPPDHVKLLKGSPYEGSRVSRLAHLGLLAQ